MCALSKPLLCLSNLGSNELLAVLPVLLVLPVLPVLVVLPVLPVNMIPRKYLE